MSETGRENSAATEVVDAEVRGLLEALRECLSPPAGAAAQRVVGEAAGDARDKAPARASSDGIDEAARRVGTAAAAAGMGIGVLVTRLLESARDQAAAGEPSGANHPRRDPLIEEAVAEAASAWERARELRRDAWLSFLTHEMKNPLNTVLNALWLLREHPDAPNTTRFLDLADRGVRRIEATLKELRDLHGKAAAPAPRLGTLLSPPQTHH